MHKNWEILFLGLILSFSFSFTFSSSFLWVSCLFLRVWKSYEGSRKSLRRRGVWKGWKRRRSRFTDFLTFIHTRNYVKRRESEGERCSYLVVAFALQLIDIFSLYFFVIDFFEDENQPFRMRNKFWIPVKPNRHINHN